MNTENENTESKNAPENDEETPPLGPMIFSVPEEGILFQTFSGRPLFGVHVIPEGARFDLYDANGANHLQILSTVQGSAVYAGYGGKLGVSMAAQVTGGSVIVYDADEQPAQTLDATPGLQYPASQSPDLGVDYPVVPIVPRRNHTLN